MREELVAQGINLMATGMSTVLVFLALLVLLTITTSAVMSRFFPDKDPEAPSAGAVSVSAAPAAVDPRTLRVIKAAIDKHRAKTAQG